MVEHRKLPVYLATSPTESQLALASLGPYFMALRYSLLPGRYQSFPELVRSAFDARVRGALHEWHAHRCRCYS